MTLKTEVASTLYIKKYKTSNNISKLRHTNVNTTTITTTTTTNNNNNNNESSHRDLNFRF